MRAPIDSPQRKTASKARAQVHVQLDSDHWDYHEETGGDYGRDCVCELSEDGYFLNHKIEGQIKGTYSPQYLKTEAAISFSLQTITWGYALGSSIAFVLFLVDLNSNTIYATCLQEYAKEHKDIAEKIEKQDSVVVRIPKANCLPAYDLELQRLAKTVFFREEID